MKPTNGFLVLTLDENETDSPHATPRPKLVTPAASHEGAEQIVDEPTTSHNPINQLVKPMYPDSPTSLPSVVLDLAKLKFLNCGVARLCLHLGESLLHHGADRFRYQFLLPNNRKELFPGHEENCVALRPGQRQRVRRWSRYFGVKPFGQLSCDLWHWTHQDSEYWPPNATIPVVLNIHDLNFLYEGKGPRKVQQRLRRLQAKIDRASCIVSVSEFTASEIRHHLDVSKKDVHVVHNGVDSPEPQSGVRPAFLPQGEFLFTISDISPKKNFRVLIDLAEQLPDFRIVVAGRKTSDYAQAMEQEIFQRGLQWRILMPGEINNEDRQWLYQNCSAFVFPSLAEGFGLPVIEAMMLGRPVFMSDRTSLPEVGGPLGFYWNTFEPRAMAEVFQQGMQIVRNDRSYSDKLRQYAARFSWEHAVTKYLAVYETTLAQHAASPYDAPNERVPISDTTNASRRRCA